MKLPRADTFCWPLALLWLQSRFAVSEASFPQLEIWVSNFLILEMRDAFGQPHPKNLSLLGLNSNLAGHGSLGSTCLPQQWSYQACLECPRCALGGREEASPLQANC